MVDFSSEKVKGRPALAFGIEIDENFKENLSFLNPTSLVRMLFSDGILDLHTAFLYEKINFISIRNSALYNQKRIDNIMHTEIEIGLLYENKIIVESPVMEINRLYLNTQKLLKCKEGIQAAKSLFGTR